MPAQFDLILEGVTDPVLRARLGLLLAELKATWRSSSRRDTWRIGPQLSIWRNPRPANPRSCAIASRPWKCARWRSRSPPPPWDHWGWQADASGRIVTDTGRTVFSAGFVTAIGKVLKSLRSDPT